MALFDGRLPGTNIVVDNLGLSQPGRLHHFLSNHSMAGEAILECPGPISCSQTTRDLLMLQFPDIRTKLRPLEVGISHSLDLGGEAVKVTLVAANHCLPGAVMFIFGGSFGKVMHTGSHACIWRDAMETTTDRE